jgi:hypothetical protein
MDCQTKSFRKEVSQHDLEAISCGVGCQGRNQIELNARERIRANHLPNLAPCICNDD